jgi:integrase
MGYKNVGKTLAEWEDAAPFTFSLSEEVGPIDDRYRSAIIVDLSDLRRGFSARFLVNLKDLLIEWRKTISLTTVASRSKHLRILFKKVVNLGLFDSEIDVIDETFLLALDATVEEITESPLQSLRLLFLNSPDSQLWAPGLHADYFPLFKHKKGRHGRQISRILAKALTRSACVHILSRCEHAYDLGEIDIGLFAYANLAFAVFCRPESYRQIQLRDLIFDKKSNSYYLYILPTKTNVENPTKICYKINEPLGVLLQKQRQNVVEQYSHLVDVRDVSRLALFPARELNGDKSAWRHKYANDHFGMYKDSKYLTVAYPRQIQKRCLSIGLSIGANVLRHTVGTQLAQTGASSRTIQAVLKHATDIVCRAYVDIAFNGLIQELSDAMQPAFEKHLPVFTRFRSKYDCIDPAQAIRSDDLHTGKIELTGECGKLIQCEYSPITCYGCARFIPCWDADHSVNLAIVEQEIEDYKRRGKPFEQLIERARTAKYQIILVMNSADRYLQRKMSEA